MDGKAAPAGSAESAPAEAAPAAEPEAAPEESPEEEQSCPIGPHSFVGSTPVLMADGSAKPISQVKVGDQITDAVPGDSAQQTHTVQNVIVTQTDHDFVDLTIKKLASKLGKAVAGIAVAAAAVLGTAAPASADTPSTLTTTYHHPFYDITQSAFVDAVDLHPGDQLQTADGGTAEITSVRTYHQTATTYDLTINGLHTYYVDADDTTLLVHNNNGESCPITSSGSVRGPDGRYKANPDAVKPGELDSDGMLRGTNKPGYVTSRPGFRSGTYDDAWEGGEEGPNGGVMCARGGPNCVGEVFREPEEGQHPGDMGHWPQSWSNRQFSPDVTREQILDDYQQGVRIECVPCNRGAGNRLDG